MTYLLTELTFRLIIQNFFFDLLLPKTKPIVIGILYRPPKQTGFLNNISETLTNIPQFNERETYILGDININLLCEEQKIPMGIRRYREFCALQGLTQIIKNATRITEKSSSLLDHILTTSKEKISQSGILDIGISDHQLIYFTRKTLRPKTGEQTFIKIRHLKNYSKDKLLKIYQRVTCPTTPPLLM